MSRVIGMRRYLADILQRGRSRDTVCADLPCQEGNKTKQLLEATLSLSPVELNMVSETDEGQLGAEGMAELGSDVSTVDGKIKSEPTDVCAVNLTDLVHVEPDASPPSKRPRLGSIEKINLAQQLYFLE